MDYSRLRAAALRSGEDEEAVTVDTRALIDKVLARYSGEWTTLRELIQNAADAQSTGVKIKWETIPSTQVPLPQTPDRSEMLKHIVSHHTLRRLLVQNDGQPFTKTDWGRLKRIAEGNPDETKIGAFGVGFYSVFADCEEPFVSSGNEAMAFYWKGNALFTRKLQLPPGEGSGDTAFVLDYRNTTTPLPSFLSVSQFLATSLTFVALESIEFWVDDYQILALRKKTSPSLAIAIPRDLETKTKEGLMRLSTAEQTSAQIDATSMAAVGWKPHSSSSANRGETSVFGSPMSDMPSLKTFFSRFSSSPSPSASRTTAGREEKAVQIAVAEDLTAVSTSTVFLRVTTAAILTHVSASFATELERATKKPPPKVTKLAILTSSYDEVAASESSISASRTAKAADIFSSVLPSKKPGGRIFIGFPTTQTTGAGMHISAPSVIPTVEREAIDLNARWVRSWNIEMLRIAGILARLAFSKEMSALDGKLRREAELAGTASTPSRALVERFVPEALHILKTYSFAESTPSAHVAQIMEEAFWTSYKQPAIEVYSSRGVMLTTKVRVDSEQLSRFVDRIPVILPSMKEAPFIKKLIDFALISDISVQDVRAELGTKALSRDQMKHFISWAGSLAESGERGVRSLLDVAVAAGGDSGDIIALGSISNYLVPSRIPSALPIPPTTLPVIYTDSIPPRQLQALGWEPLQTVPWLRFLIESAAGEPEDRSLTGSPAFAAQVLAVLSRNWNDMNQSSRDSVVSALQHVTVIPTRSGMRRPAESFFPSVKLFEDLPVIQGCQGVKEKFLSALGVRKTVDLDTIFARLLSPAPGDAEGGDGRKRWSHVELIKYLASVKDDIPADDMRKLRGSRLCPAENEPAAGSGSGSGPAGGAATLYRVSDLFEPKDTLRALKLPILQWPGRPGGFRSASPEAQFLYLLGLRQHPSAQELVDMMAGPDVALRRLAMTYFISSHQSNGYFSSGPAAVSRPILPIEGGGQKLVSPSDCYTNEAAAVLGYNILRRDLHQHAGKFHVARDPPISGCVERLVSKPPPDRRAAATLFEYFASRLADLGENSLAKLRDAPIVPVPRRSHASAASSKDGDQPAVMHTRPQHCYLGSSAAYGDIFDFVDFGSSANAFLFKCGAKTEPSKAEIAQLACAEPARLLSVLQSSERYLNLLRSLADDLPLLRRDKELFRRMKSAPFLLGSREISASRGREPGSHEEDEAPIRHYQLAAASQVVILDDYISYRLFKDSLVCAPEEDALEAFYMALGSQTLGSQVQEDLRIGPHAQQQDAARWLQRHVLERTKIFLYEYSKYKRDSIKHDAKWLEQNLMVEVVRSLALRRSLKGHGQSHTEKRSAAAMKAAGGGGGGHTLYVAAEGRPDMYQVGQAVCQMLLNRPSQQAYFFFEPFLKLDLLDLRGRGYNVDRILRAKAAEARIAEEERRKALEAEQERIQEQEREWTRQTQHAVAEAAREAARTPERRRPRMPGSFGDSPPEADAASQGPAGQAAQQPPRKSRGFFSNLTRRLGLEETEAPQKQLQSFLPGAGAGGDVDHRAAPPGPGPRGPQAPPGDDGRVTSPAVVQQNLLNAIKSTRAHDAAHLFSPPQQTQVEEQASYCDATPAHNIDLAAEAPGGMRVFVARDLAAGGDPARFLAANTAAIGQFERVLREAGGVYGVAPTALHMFYDEAGKTIAFNSAGSVFCNLRFFLQLHADKVGGAGGAGAGVAEATAWWWVVLAHELAHNLVPLHNSDHSYYTESFIQQYFPKMVARAVAWAQPQPQPAAGPSAAGPSAAGPPAAGPSAAGTDRGVEASLLD